MVKKMRVPRKIKKYWKKKMANYIPHPNVVIINLKD
jgi:hypothetical protein